MGEGAGILFNVHKDIVSVKIHHSGSAAVVDWFESSNGLMGTFQGGKMLARDNATILEDPIEMGQEWQVLDR